MAVPSIVLRVEVENPEACIWRIVRVPSVLPLSELHRVLQLVLGWRDRRAHAFEIQDRRPVTARRTSTPEPTRSAVVDERCTIAETLATAHDAFMYRYGGESTWRVRVSRAAGVWRGRQRPMIECLDGYLAGPPDDGPGPDAYAAVLAATLGRGPALTAAQRAWLGSNFDPERFDRGEINRGLALLAVPPSDRSRDT